MSARTGGCVLMKVIFRTAKYRRIGLGFVAIAILLFCFQTAFAQEQ